MGCAGRQRPPPRAHGGRAHVSPPPHRHVDVSVDGRRTGDQQPGTPVVRSARPVREAGWPFGWAGGGRGHRQRRVHRPRRVVRPLRRRLSSAPRRDDAVSGDRLVDGQRAAVRSVAAPRHDPAVLGVPDRRVGARRWPPRDGADRRRAGQLDRADPSQLRLHDHLRQRGGHRSRRLVGSSRRTGRAAMAPSAARQCARPCSRLDPAISRSGRWRGEPVRPPRDPRQRRIADLRARRQPAGRCVDRGPSAVVGAIRVRYQRHHVCGRDERPVLERGDHRSGHRRCAARRRRRGRTSAAITGNRHHRHVGGRRSGRRDRVDDAVPDRRGRVQLAPAALALADLRLRPGGDPVRDL